MKFYQRLAYYLGGFTMGLVLLFFFLSGKRASCNYMPNDRVLNDIGRKSIRYSEHLRSQIQSSPEDTLIIKKILLYGKVDFSKSDKGISSCNEYTIYGKKELKNTYLKLRNCSNYAVIDSLVNP